MRPFIRHSFFRRLFLSYSLLVLVAAAVIGALVLGDLRRNALADLEENLFSVARLVAAMEAANPTHLYSPRLPADVGDVAREADLHLTLLLANGRLLADSRPTLPALAPAAWIALPEIDAARRHGRGTATRAHPADIGDRTFFLAVPILIEFEVAGFVRVGMPLERLAARRRDLGRRVAAGASLSALIALALGFFFTRNHTHPLARIAEVCRQLATGDFTARVNARRPDEIGLVATTVDTMAADVQRRILVEQRERERLATILAAMADGVIAVSARGTIAYINRVAAELLALDLAAATDAPVARWLTLPPILDLHQRARDESRRVSGEIRLQAHPHDRVLAVSATPLIDARDAAFGVLLVLHDLTELRRLEEVRRSFTANVSHELKTPLTAIAAIVSALLDDPGMPRPDRQRFLTRIAAQGDRLHELVNDLLVLARLESAAHLLERVPVDLDAIIALAHETFQPVAAQKNITLVAPAEPADLIVPGDREALRLIVNNLVNNAVAYTPPGGRVELHLRCAGDTAVIVVRDTGIGIAPEHLARIFERFYRVDPARDRTLGGSGLGLAIVKHLVQALDAHILAESTPGQGTTFTVQLNLTHPTP